MKELKITINLDGQGFEKVSSEKVEIILNMVNNNRKVEPEATAEDEETFK